MRSNRTTDARAGRTARSHRRVGASDIGSKNCSGYIAILFPQGLFARTPELRIDQIAGLRRPLCHIDLQGLQLVPDGGREGNL